MCNRYAEYLTDEEYADYFEVGDPPPREPRYNIAPTQDAPVVCLRGTERVVLSHRWGLVPKGSSDLSIGNRLLNARSETVATRSAFREAFRTSRCVVPTNGFFEWKRVGRIKQPYYVRRRDGRPLALAGLRSVWTSPSNEQVPTFTVLTTEPNEAIRDLHDRMPVVLEQADLATWLDPSAESAALETLFAPAADDLLELVAVSTFVNNAQHEGPRCIQPIAVEGSLFD